MKIDTETMTVDEALDVVRALRVRYGWAVRVLTRSDAESAYEGDDAEGEFSDEEWGKLRSSRAWRDLCDMESEDWDRVHSVVYSVLGSAEDRAPKDGTR